jgi:hypothetical protein
MTLWFIGGLFALALVDLVMRRGSEVDRHPSSETASKQRGDLSFLLRPLIPSYRFFDRIEARLELRLRTLDPANEAGPWMPAPSPPARPWYFWLHNPRENLWLAEQALLPGILDDDGGENESPEFLLVSAQCRAALPKGQSFQFAIFSADVGDDAPVFVSPILKAQV